MPINSTLTLRKRNSYSELQPALQNIIFIMQEFESEEITTQNV